MDDTKFLEIEAEYLAALRRSSEVSERVRELRGPAFPLGTQSPPELGPELRKAESEAQQAWNDYIAVRDRYWPVRWGWANNKPETDLPA